MPLGCWIIQPEFTTNLSTQEPGQCAEICSLRGNYTYSAIDQSIHAGQNGACYCMNKYTAGGRSAHCNSLCRDQTTQQHHFGYLCGFSGGQYHASVYAIRTGESNGVLCLTSYPNNHAWPKVRSCRDHSKIKYSQLSPTKIDELTAGLDVDKIQRSSAGIFKGENSCSCRGFVTQFLEPLTSIWKTLVQIPEGLRCVFSSTQAVSSSTFVREEGA